MADVKKIATRESYGNTLKELAAEGHEDLVVLDADLAAATKTGMFRKAYPDRHFDCGIAEGNMMGVAAGLATMGYVPFVSSFAMFAAGRAFEQIRNSIAYPRLNVKIGATHGGISVGEDGASHQCCEDFALMRSLPGMTVICPADDVEARAAVRAAYAMQGPVYLRFGRLAVPVFHDEATYHFELGKGEQITEGSDIAIIATGLMVNEARLAAEQLAAEGIHARVINIHTIKPLDEEIVLKAAKECGKVITAEEHSVIGGLGEAVCAVLSEKLPTPVRRVGVQDKFGCSGPAWDLLKEYGLDGIDIDSEEVYEYFQDACSELADEAQYISFDEELVMSLYVDGNGVIRGRSFEFNDGWSNYTVEILNPHKGGKIGFKAAVTVDNQEFSIAGSGKESGGRVSGDFSAKYNGTAIVDLTVKNFDTDALKKGYLNGTVTVKAASGIGKVLYGMSSVPSMVTDLAVTVDVSMDGKSGKLAVSVAEDKDKWGTVSVSAKKESGKKASVPADKNTVFIEDYSDVEDYWDTVDLDSLINTLDKLDVPSFVTDILEDFADLDGDELLENAEYIIYNNLYSGYNW